MKNAVLSLTSALCILLSSCVPVPPELMPKAPGAGQATAASYPDIDPTGTSVSSLHFTIKGYNPSVLQSISGVAESLYNKIGTDTGLYSYLAGQSYTLVVYKDENEYASKTKQPPGSHAVTAGNAIYMYPGPEYEPALAHQMMHLIFNSYMGQKMSTLNWLGEGLAMTEEVSQMPDTERVAFQTAQNNKLRTDRMPFSQMTFFVGSDEPHRRTDAWYLQVESVMAFLLRQGTSLTFAAFLNELRNGADLDHALADNYSGKYRGTADFETSWVANL